MEVEKRENEFPLGHLRCTWSSQVKMPFKAIETSEKQNLGRWKDSGKLHEKG